MRHAARADLDPQPHTISVLRYIQATKDQPLDERPFFVVLVRGSSKNGMMLAEMIAKTFEVAVASVRQNAESIYEVFADEAMRIEHMLNSGLQGIVVPSSFSWGGSPNYEKQFVDLFQKIREKSGLTTRVQVLSTFDSPKFIEYNWTCGQGVVYTDHDRKEALTKKPSSEPEQEVVDNDEEEAEMNANRPPIDLTDEERVFLERLVECRSMMVIENLLDDDVALTRSVLSATLHHQLQKALTTRKLDEVRIVLHRRLGQNNKADEIRAWLDGRPAK